MSLSAAEIEHVSNLFEEKQAELQSAVLRVDQVTQTLLGRARGKPGVGLPLDLNCFQTVNPAAGGAEERTSAASCGRTRRPESIGPVWSCCPGAEEALPGAAGQSNVFLIPLFFPPLQALLQTRVLYLVADVGVRRPVTALTWSRATNWPKTKSC